MMHLFDGAVCGFERLATKWLLAEECTADFYTGWWLYLRDRNDHSINDDGEWGWQRHEHQLEMIERFLSSFCHDPPHAARHCEKLAAWFGGMFPKGLRVLVDRYGDIAGLA